MSTPDVLSAAVPHCFCANPQCVLHVSLEDGGSAGNWAELEGGIVVGRSRYEGRMLCDLCGRRAIQNTSVSAQHVEPDGLTSSEADTPKRTALLNPHAQRPHG